MKKRTVLVLDDAIVKQAKKKAIDEDMSFSALVENLLVGSVNNEEAKEKLKKGWPGSLFRGLIKWNTVRS